MRSQVGARSFLDPLPKLIPAHRAESVLLGDSFQRLAESVRADRSREQVMDPVIIRPPQTGPSVQRLGDRMVQIDNLQKAERSCAERALFEPQRRSAVGPYPVQPRLSLEKTFTP
jgi:hypothetical protein